jgi:hypothetical protein
MFMAPFGAGHSINTQLPAYQTPVPESDQAAPMGRWNFIRTLGSVWVVAISVDIDCQASQYSGLLQATQCSSTLAVDDYL